MLDEQKRKQLNDIVIKMKTNNESDNNIQFVVDDFKQKYSKIEQPNKQDEFVNKLIKTGDIFGKGLEIASKFTGVKSAVDLGLTAGKGFSYGLERLTGKSPEEALRMVGKKPSTEIEKITEEKGLGAGLKNVLGKTVETGFIASPFVKGAKAVEFIGKLAKQFPNIARYAGYGTQGAKYGLGFGTTKSLQEDKNFKGVIKDAVLGAITGAFVGVAIPAVVEGTVRAVKNVATLYSGVPKDALERAFNNPEKVGLATRKYAKDLEATQEILNKANRSFEEIKKIRSENYQKALEKLQNSGYKPKTNRNIMVGALNKIGSKFNIKILPKAEQNKFIELQELYKGWDDFTPIGLNDLEQALRNQSNFSNSSSLNVLITKMEVKLRDVVNKVDPKIGEMNKAYSKASGFIENLQKEIFGKSSKLSDSTKLNRLLSIFNQKSDVKMKLVQELGEKTGQDLLNEITGAAISSWLPVNWVQRFILATGGLVFQPQTAGMLPLAIPRIVGKAARVLGQASRLTPTINKYGQPIINKIINE